MMEYKIPDFENKIVFLVQNEKEIERIIVHMVLMQYCCEIGIGIELF